MVANRTFERACSLADQFGGTAMHFDEGLSLMFELLPKKANLLLVDGWNREERTARCIQAYEIMDSRGFPTIEARLILDNGKSVNTSIPSGTSIGKHEALELRDQDPKRFDGNGVIQAVTYINTLIAPKLVGVSPLKQQEIDHWLIKADSTPNKSKLGANTMLAVSQLIAKAGAVDQGMSVFKYINALHASIFKEKIAIEKLPSPIFSMINGGKHANNNLEFQEFHVIPSSSLSYSKAYQMGVELFHEVYKVLIYRGANTSVGVEGGYSPSFSTNTDALEVLNETIIQRDLKPGMDVFLGVDIASSNFYKNDRYEIKDKPHPLKRDEYIDFIKNLTYQASDTRVPGPSR
jgi:enolase